jgi:hypothetical protein
MLIGWMRRKGILQTADKEYAASAAIAAAAGASPCSLHVQAYALFFN